MSGIRLSDLPESYQRQARAQMQARWDAEEREWAQTHGNDGATQGRKDARTQAKDGKTKKPRGPNKTETRFNKEWLNCAGNYEAITFKLPGGCRYTPDWVVKRLGRIECYEVKGPHKFPSENRAQVAWSDAAAAYPMMLFMWVRWTGRNWHLEAVMNDRTAPDIVRDTMATLEKLDAPAPEKWRRTMEAMSKERA